MLYAIVAVIALIIDQAVKYWTTVNIVVDTGEAKLIPGFVHLANVHNTGAAFSFLQGARWFFVILCVIFVLIVIYALAKELLNSRLSRWMAVFVMAGAIGNCIDRIVCGYVVDMFEFDFLVFKHRFPVFNVADIYITLGVIVFCICIFVEKPKKNNAARRPKPATSAVPLETEVPKSADKKVPSWIRHQHVDANTVTAQANSSELVSDSFNPFAEWEQESSPVPSALASSITEKEPHPNTELSHNNVETVKPSITSVVENSSLKTIDSIQSSAEVSPTISTDSTEQKASTHESYNLDDILAEFRDL